HPGIQYLAQTGILVSPQSEAQHRGRLLHHVVVEGLFYVIDRDLLLSAYDLLSKFEKQLPFAELLSGEGGHDYGTRIRLGPVERVRVAQQETALLQGIGGTFQQVLWTDVLRHELKLAVAPQPPWG